MAIPIGTTGRQVHSMARWMLTCVAVAAMLMWPGASLAGWGGLIVGILATMTLWLLGQVLIGDRRLLSQGFHWALLGPVAIAAYHFISHRLAISDSWPPPAAGPLDLSLLLHLGILSVGVMLTQNLLPRSAGHAAVLTICGAAMAGGAAIALAMGGPRASVMRHTLTLLGFSGVAVWLTPLWGMGRTRRPPEEYHPFRHPYVRRALVAAAIVASLALTLTAPWSAVAAAAVMAGVLLTSSIVFPPRRALVIAIAGGLVIAATGATIVLGTTAPVVPVGPAGPAGVGGLALANVSAGEHGLTLLGWWIGWGGTLWLVGGLTAAAVWRLLAAGKRRKGDQGRAIVWTSATALATCSLLGAGGMFSPATTVAVMLTWGLAPRMLGRPRVLRPGAELLVLVAAAMVAMGVARSTGLVGWSVDTLVAPDLADKWMHAASGFLLAMVLAWVLGVRRWWLGAVGIAVAVLAGAAGEGVQQLFMTRRNPEWADWLAHGLGCLAALIFYSLCMGARACESADARPAGALESRYE
ncbi:MAG: VanZ family protein [Planctomycetota bacterium]